MSGQELRKNEDENYFSFRFKEEAGIRERKRGGEREGEREGGEIERDRQIDRPTETKR